MNTEIYLFLITGLVSMSAALSASAINRLSDEEKTRFAQSRLGAISIIFVGNFAALTLLFAMAFGFRTLHWWIPLSCLFITFPIVHVLLFQRLLGDVKNLLIMLPAVVVSDFILYTYW